MMIEWGMIDWQQLDWQVVATILIVAAAGLHLARTAAGRLKTLMRIGRQSTTVCGACPRCSRPNEGSHAQEKHP